MIQRKLIQCVGVSAENMHGSTGHNSQEMATTQVVSLINGQIKQIHTYTEILFDSNAEWYCQLLYKHCMLIQLYQTQEEKISHDLIHM